MSYLAAILLGLIQGIAEFLPISSSGHLSVFQNFFNMTTAEDGHMMFDVMLHLGTLVSVCIVYRKDIAMIIVDTIECIRSMGHPVPGGRKEFVGARLLLMMFFATLPLAIVLPINDKVETLYYNTTFIGVAFLITGFVLFFSDMMRNGKKNERSITVKDALIVGVFQAIATVPGLSRSGLTISAGMGTRLNRDFAAKFSFLISIPAILGANLLSLVKAIDTGFDTSLMPKYLVGMLVAMVSGYFSVSLVRMICRKGKFGRFAYYCWAVGIVTFVLSFIL